MKIGLITRLCLLFLLCKIFTSCSGKNADCGNFKTGTFVFHNPFTGTDILIKRTDSLQTSVDKTTGMGNKCKIEWAGDCKFNLTFLTFVINGKDSTFGETQSAVGTTTIVKTAKYYYISETQLYGEQGVHTDTAWITAE
jgi:hypothetical protein